MSPNEFYNTNLQSSKNDSALAKSRVKRYVWLRLLVFIAMLYTAFMSFSTGLWVLPTLLLLVVFLYILQLHARAESDYTIQLCRVQLGEAELRFLSGGVYAENTGLTYLSDQHPYAADIDVFGKGGLFPYINRTETEMGEKALIDMLLSPPLNKDQIDWRQQCTKELASMPQFLMQFRVLAKQAGENKRASQQLKNWLGEPPVFLSNRFIPILLWLVPAAAFAGIGLAWYGGMYGLLIWVILLNWFLAGIHLKKVNQIHTIVGKQKDILDAYRGLNDLVSKQPFNASRLNELKDKHQDFLSHLQSLSRLSATFDQRLNTMLGPVFNSLFLFDMQCVWRLERWKEENGKQMLHWLDAFAEMEMLLTCGVFGFNHPAYHYPETNKELMFSAKEMRHPVMRDAGVSNNFSYNHMNKVFIVTGSNMSGKSTFLRTMGTSLLTGMMGLPVNAASMQFSPVRILSSMRVTDSLLDHTSYFYAELKRLKFISDEIAKEETPALLLIDEMLKGTNSKEKLEGSIMIIENLVQKKCISFIATHDLALGELQNKFPEEVKNYSFESSIVNNELVFDYKIKPGVASSTNATFLLKKLNIV